MYASEYSFLKYVNQMLVYRYGAFVRTWHHTGVDGTTIRSYHRHRWMHVRRSMSAWTTVRRAAEMLAVMHHIRHLQRPT